MKYLLSLILITFSSAFIPSPDLVKIGNKIASSDSMVSHELQFTNVYGTPSQLIYITLDGNNTGEVAFSVGIPADSNSYFWGAGSKVPMTIINGVKNLHYMASDSGQIFVVTN